MSSDEPPAVFLSHAGEDNERFARDFAERLQNKGFRVWFDEWELLPGDSLVDKVFEEGLKEAEAMIVILSTNSVNKQWVRDELNAGFVKRLEGKCKLIPVIIDNVEAPEALKSTVHQRIQDLQSYEAELDRITLAILGSRNRPKPGELPRYAKTMALPGLYPTDTRVLQIAGDLALESDQELVSTADVLGKAEPDGITEHGLLESLQILEAHGYVKVHQTAAKGIAGRSAFTVTPLGLEEYAQAFIRGYDKIVEQVVSQLVNAPERGTDGRIAKEIDSRRLLVEHVLDTLEAQGLVRLTKMSGPTTWAHYVSPQLGRLLQEGG